MTANEFEQEIMTLRYDDAKKIISRESSYFSYFMSLLHLFSLENADMMEQIQRYDQEYIKLQDTFERCRQELERLREEADAREKELEDTISTCQQTVDQLTQQVSTMDGMKGTKKQSEAETITIATGPIQESSDDVMQLQKALNELKSKNAQYERQLNQNGIKSTANNNIKTETMTTTTTQLSSLQQLMAILVVGYALGFATKMLLT
jgi:chromosome segregation ATPase